MPLPAQNRKYHDSEGHENHKNHKNWKNQTIKEVLMMDNVPVTDMCPFPSCKFLKLAFSSRI